MTLQLSAFDVYDFKLLVKILTKLLVFVDLLLQACILIIPALLLLFDTVLCFGNFLIS